MSESQTLSSKRLLIGVLAVIILGVSWWIILKPSTGGGGMGSHFYFDMDTNQLFQSASTELPPITAPSGGQGVRAIVMSCGECSDKDNRFIAYLEKYTDTYKTAKSEGREISPQQTLAGWLVKGESDKNWVVANDAEGAAIRDAATSRCGTNQPAICKP